MTRDELLFSICPGYRAPNCFKGDTSCNCNNCNRILNEWLDEYDKQIRADAIDDFRKEICKMITQSENDGNYRFYAAELKQAIADLAEELKEGKS